MEKKVLAVIITYFPEEYFLKRNVEAILDYVDEIIIWENTDKNVDDYHYISDVKVRYMGVGKNIGISKALNHVVKYSIDNSYDYLVTLDQDSYFVNFLGYLDTSKKYDLSGGTIFCPEVSRVETNPNNIFSVLGQEEYAITSGMLLPVSIIANIGGFCEDFFVDAIDVDVCIRFHNAGFNIVKNGNGVLLQHFGAPQKFRFLGRDYTTPNYSPMRLEGIFRNHIIIYRRCKAPFLKKLVAVYFKHHVSRIVLFEERKWRKLSSIVKGIWEGYTFKL